MKEKMDIKQNITTMNHIERVSFPCPKCGKTAEADITVVLTSVPPQYSYYCPYCGSHGSISCSYVDRYQFNKKVWDVIDDAVESTATPQTHCIICGEETSSVNKINGPYICENCKKAILKLRRMVEDKDND